MERPKGNGFPSLEIFSVLFCRMGVLGASEPFCPCALRLCPLPSHQLIHHDPSTAPREMVTKAFPVGAAGDSTTARTLLGTCGACTWFS